MLIDRYSINEIIQKSGLKPDKDYGQNFLIDQTLSARIVDALNLEQNDNVLEVGPGAGSLTHFLSFHDNQITAVDIDSRMVNFLKVVYQGSANIHVIENDIRKVDVSSFTVILGNLPYNITTELVVYLLLNGTKAHRFVLMCQTEAFPRFSETVGKDYGPVSILIHLLGTSTKLFSVKPGSFYPAPKCGSTVFEILVNDSADHELCKKVYLLAKQLFLNRRKTILNNLVGFLKDKNKATDILKKCGISPNKRPEQVGPYEFLDIYKLIR